MARMNTQYSETLNSTNNYGVQLGDFMDVGNKRYVFIISSGSLATGNVAFSTAAASRWNCDTAITTLNAVQGVALTAISSGRYGFLQTDGHNAYILKASGAAVTAGGTIIADSANAGKVTSVASATAPTQRFIGVAFEAFASGTTSMSGNLCLTT